ncbi:MAG: 6-phosphogluconolactonase [Thiolinea sp.]
MAQHELAWDKVAITLTDERQVPAEHERSNARLLRENFLEKCQVGEFIPLFCGQTDEVALRNTTTRLQEHCLPLDVCVVGMGTDGHFASLFPAARQLAAGLDPDNPAALIVVTADHIPEPRLSLTLAAILTAPHIHLLITGEEKHAVLEQARKAAEAGTRAADAAHQLPDLPIQTLIEQAGERLSIHYAA